MMRRPGSLAALRLTRLGEYRVPPLTTAADAGRQVQRRHRDAVPEGDGHGVDRHPVPRIERRGKLGELRVERLQEADLVEEGALGSVPIATAILAEAMLEENLKSSGTVSSRCWAWSSLIVKRSILIGEVASKTLLSVDLAGVERHGGVEDLEGRTLLVDAERGAVEQRFVGEGPGAVGIEGRQRGHGEDLAVGRVHDDGGGADGGEFLHRARDLLARPCAAGGDRWTAAASRRSAAAGRRSARCRPGRYCRCWHSPGCGRRRCPADRCGAPRPGIRGRECRGD